MKIALIDLDGTVADYDAAIRSGVQKLLSPSERMPDDLYVVEDEPWWKARMDLVKRQPGFWRNLEVIPVGMMVYHLLGKLGYRRMVLTKGPWKTTQAWTEKVDWCREHLPDADITITHDKSLVYGKVLFDDFPPYIEGWLQHRPRGRVIMRSTLYNAGFEHTRVMRIPETLVSVANIRSDIARFLEGL